MWIDNFEGERPEAEDLDTATLQEIRRKTLAALADSGDVTPKFIWHNQIRAIDDELEWRDSLRVQKGFGNDTAPDDENLKGEPLT